MILPNSMSVHVQHLSSTTVAWGGVAASAFVFLASGPHLLGDGGYSYMAVAWTVVTIFGMGLAFPGEQTVTRAVPSGDVLTVAAAVRLRLLTLAVLMLPLLGLFVWGPLPILGGSVVWGVGAAVGIFGWAAVSVERGRLVGSHKFHHYAVLLGVEATTRVALCVCAWLFPQYALWFLASAIGVPLFMSATVGWWLCKSEPRLGHFFVSARFAEQSAMTVVALSVQVVLNTAPLWLAARAVVPVVVVGAFVSATSYMRVPIIFAGGGQAMLLSHSSAAATLYTPRDLYTLARRSTVTAAVLCTALVVVLLLISTPVLYVLYGPGMNISWTVLVMLGAATVVSVVSTILTQLYFGCQRSPSAATMWLAAAVATTSALAMFSTSVLAAATVVCAGVLLVMVGLFAVLPHAVRDPDVLSKVGVDL